MQFEKYRIKINPLDMHHVMAFASLYIGDSQTMAAEAGVLGVPFVRFNDFVGRIGYLRELEDKYEFGYGIKASAEGSVDALCERVETLVSMPSAERKATFAARREKMLNDKIDCAKFLTWFIENYPTSARKRLVTLIPLSGIDLNKGKRQGKTRCTKTTSKTFYLGNQKIIKKIMLWMND